MKHTIIGTAGHIDHGKTMLVKALTGVDADRLPEEKQRGMTIDLGFVPFGRDASIIDVPGHEKFIRNMLAGVSTIDLVILVIAADDGVMPQTREHFEILKLLGIRHGIIALTKVDLVDDEWLEVVREDVAGLVGGTFLENAPLVCLSSLTGRGVDELKSTLEAEIARTPEKHDKGVFRLWVDRSFVLKGIGNVVTGTVLSGRLKAGEKLELLPRRKTARVRKLQIHNLDVESCGVGQRVAINLIGLERAEIRRGDMLAAEGYFRPTYMVNGKLYLLGDARPLENRTRIRFHVGSVELLARVVLLGRQALGPGEQAIVQFRLENPVALDTGERYIIRTCSHSRTIGGGSIVETHPRKLKYLSGAQLKQYENLEDGSARDYLLHLLGKRPLESFTVETLTRELAGREQEVLALVTELIGNKTLAVVTEKPATTVVLAGHFAAACTQLVEFLEKFHRENPYLGGIKLSELKSKIFDSISTTVFEAIVLALSKEQRIVVEHETMRLAGHRIVFSERDKRLRDRIDRLYLDAGFVTPSVRDVFEGFSGVREADLASVIRAMLELGTLVEIRTGQDKPVLFHLENVKRAGRILVDLLQAGGEIRISDFREAIGSSRKYATPLLIYFDQRGLSERIGEVRKLKNPEALNKL